jgi:hypothetical protein
MDASIISSREKAKKKTERKGINAEHGTGEGGEQGRTVTVRACDREQRKKTRKGEGTGSWIPNADMALTRASRASETPRKQINKPRNKRKKRNRERVREREDQARQANAGAIPEQQRTHQATAGS